MPSAPQLPKRLSPWRQRAVLTVLAIMLSACGEQHVAVTPPPRFAVLSTFPAEMAPLLVHMSIDHTEMVNGRMFRFGTLAGVPVVLGVTGIGLLNAANTTGELLDRFEVAGVLLSAVAGGTDQQIGDVAVPEAFTLIDGTTYAADPKWLALVSTLVASGRVSLERCTVVANPPPTAPVCMPQQPAVWIGGIGLSSDHYATPFMCTPGGTDLYGCDLPAGAEATGLPGERAALMTVTAADATMPVTMDMETAAIAREASTRGVPFIGFRAISDGGSGDMLGLSGFLPQFSAYYRFAARNAAAAAVAFLQQVTAAR